MRNLFIYEVIRYYPNIRGDEFFNIGIRLSDSSKHAKIEFIQKEHLKHIHRFPSIEKKVITSMLDQLKASENFLHSWYGNYLKISEEKIHRSKDSFENVMKTLYEDFIGYKFHKKENVDPIEQIKEKTKLLVSSEFKSYLHIEKDDVFDFMIYDKNNIRHFSDVGRVSNRTHVNRMLWQREEYSFSSIKDEKAFDFLNISHESPKVAQNLLRKNEIAVVPYDNDDMRYEYLRELIK